MPRRTPWAAAAVAVLAVLVVCDFLLGRDANITGTLALPPFVAAIGATVAATAGVGVLSVAAGVALTLHDDAGMGATTVRLVTVIVASLAAPLLARERLRREQRLLEVRRVAEVAQLAVLTPVPARAGPLRLASSYISASKEALIGGDLYGVVTTPFGVRIVVADVKGKGLDAVRLAALVLSTFRETAGTAAALTEVATSVDGKVTPLLGDEDFVTAVFACFAPDGRLDLVNCGHPPPTLTHAGHSTLMATAYPSAPLGLGPLPVEENVQLAEGDRVLFYTDGLVETRAKGGGFVSAESAIAGIGTDSLDTALENVITRLRSQAEAGLRDDLALLLAEYCPSDVT